MNRAALLIAGATVGALALFPPTRRAGLDTIDQAIDMTTTAITPDLLNVPNVRAFLRTIRHAEGTAGPTGYRMLFGGALFDSYDDHPRTVVTRKSGTKPISSTAAGAYQILSRTWDEAKKGAGLTDFAPPSQDLAALWLIRRRGALRDVIAGRFDDAIRKCANEWASLPGSPYGQPVKTLTAVRAVYTSEGGRFA